MNDDIFISADMEHEAYMSSIKNTLSHASNIEDTAYATRFRLTLQSFARQAPQSSAGDPKLNLI